jgi:hypothetical protein
MITKRQTIRNTPISTLGHLVKSAVVFTLSLLMLAAWPVSTPATAKEHHSDSTNVLGSDLSTGWLDKPVHSHFSPLGTPLIHPFLWGHRSFILFELSLLLRILTYWWITAF